LPPPSLSSGTGSGRSATARGRDIFSHNEPPDFFPLFWWALPVKGSRFGPASCDVAAPARNDSFAQSTCERAFGSFCGDAEKRTPCVDAGLWVCAQTVQRASRFSLRLTVSLKKISLTLVFLYHALL
jgi:hypothetical protein